MGDDTVRTKEAWRPPRELALWRQARLLHAGFDAATAAELSTQESIDFHELLGLVDHGCPPHLAARIVAPLDAEPERC